MNHKFKKNDKNLNSMGLDGNFVATYYDEAWNVATYLSVFGIKFNKTWMGPFDNYSIAADFAIKALDDQIRFPGIKWGVEFQLYANYGNDRS